MTIPNGPAVTIARLRQELGLPAERPVGTRDVLAIPCTGSEPGEDATTAGPLALGDLPEEWRRDPASGPRYLITLRVLPPPYRVAGIWETDPARWGEDSSAPPSRRLVPLLAPAYVPAAVLAGRPIEAGLVFGWLSTEDQYAFL
jgi:hypothetical protein